MRRRRRSERGWTIVEVAVSIVLLGAIAGTAAWIGPTQLRAIVRSHEQNVALRAATSRIERLRAAVPEPGTRAAPLDGLRPSDLPDAAATETVAPAGEGLVRVAVEVTWAAADGGRASVVAETLVATEDRR